MSHDTRVAGTHDTHVTVSDYNHPQISRRAPSSVGQGAMAHQRSSILSVDSSSHGPGGLAEYNPKSAHSRPSAIPRSISNGSQTRLNVIASSRRMPAYPAKSPNSFRDNIPMNADMKSDYFYLEFEKLRRTRTTSPSDLDIDTLRGTDISQRRQVDVSSSLPPRLIPELQALAAGYQRPNQPAAPSISTVSSPSTQMNTSPSPWSASTAATTPTSWSSTSPCIIQPLQRQQSGTSRSHTVPIPATTRTKLPKLPILQESLPPSTVSSQADIKSKAVQTPKKKRAGVLDSPAPSPPPRSSSVRRTRSRSTSASGNTDSTERKLQQSKDLSPPPLPQPNQSTVITNRNVREPAEKVIPASNSDISQRHNRLQEALRTVPARPSRDGTTNLDTRRNQPVNTNILHDGRRERLLDSAAMKPPYVDRKGHEQHRLEATVSESESSLPLSGKSRLAKFSRLALFGRGRNTSDSEQKVNKSPKKGPIAGTGHEGYGKYVRRGRKTSTDGASAATDSETSIASTTRRPFQSASRKDSFSGRSDRNSQSDLDEFAASRLKPVVLLGGSQRRKQGSSPSLEPIVLRTGDSTASGSAFQSTQTPSQDSQETPHPHTVVDPVPTQSVAQSRRHDDMEELSRFPEMPQPEDSTSTKLQRWDTSQSSELPDSVAVSEGSQDNPRTTPGMVDAINKKSRRLRWNIFRRKDSISESSRPVIIRQLPIASELPVSVSTVTAPRSVPFYAMIESESEATTTEALGQYLDEASRSPGHSQDWSQILQNGRRNSEDDATFEKSHVLRAESILLPSAPELWSQKPHPPREPVHVEKPVHHTAGPPLLPKDTSTKRPRLAQVGRIPKVISHQTRTTHENSTTFQSRQNPSMPTSLATQSVETAFPNASERPVLEIRTDLLPPGTFNMVGSGKAATASARVTEETFLTSQNSDTEFLRHPERQSSDVSISSSSDGVISIMGPPLLPSHTYVRPISYNNVEDEVWNEYDDFIDHVMSPSRPRKSTYDSPHHSHARKVENASMTLNKGLAILHPASLSQEHSDRPLLVPNPEFALSSLTLKPSSEEIRLRRSKIAAALHTSIDPSSPFSMREFIADYNHSNRGSSKLSGRFSASSASVASPTAPPTTEQLVESGQQRQYENATHMDDMERSKNPAKHSERSYASLMVSRWLSFGRVLFSPAHNEIQQLPGRHVLVVDGLGNEDWSIYCAVTYQEERVFVHDLKAKKGSNRTARPSKTSKNVPANHRQAEVSTFNDKFPFPPSFFSAVVLRFPPAMADQRLKNIISECKRVLSPGGYLELMLLDLDIVNMGVLTRRAVRNLKIKMSTNDRDVSLKPIIDNMQAVLNSNGFSNLNRCIVGVPVVGKPSGSMESSASSRSSGGSIGQQKRSSVSPRPLGGLGYPQDNFSLNDLVADYSENADAKIGRMVSRTARGWWQHCFEAAVISDGNLAKSVFADKELLQECKARASSFKLLIAYTQKPPELKRRTMSEPVVPTLATAGPPKSGRKVK